MTITSTDDILQLIEKGCDDWSQYGDVGVKRKDDLMLFNYTHAAAYANRWNAFERMSRGLIFDTLTPTLKARPFDKFFNFGESDRFPTTPMTRLYEKMDGSLGILYQYNNEAHIATRGSFESDQALWATEYYRERWGNVVPYPWTLLFEIIYPENRIVVDYGYREDLVVLAARHLKTGEYAPWPLVEIWAKNHDARLPQSYDPRDPNEIEQMMSDEGTAMEGFVAEYEDGSRFKFKSKAYFTIARALASMSPKAAIRAFQDGSIDDVSALVPDELRKDWDSWVDSIRVKIISSVDTVKESFENAPKGDRREYAEWVKANTDRANWPLMFAQLDGKPLEPLLFKSMLRNPEAAIQRDHKSSAKTL